MRRQLLALGLLTALVGTSCGFIRGGEEGAQGGDPNILDPDDAVVAPPLPPAPGSPIPVEPDGGIGDGAGPLPDEPTTSPDQEPGDGEPGNPGGARQVEPHGNVVDPHPVDWESATIDRDAMTITLTWWSGVEPCTVLDRVDIVYGDNVVTVTVWEGAPPEAATISCIAIAEQKQTTVDLAEDVGDRSLADGAEG